MQTEQHQQLVRKRMEFKTKGIGAIAMTGKPIGAKITLKFFDPILTFSSLIVAVINLLGWTGAVGDNKADITSQRTDFDLDHDPSLFVPASGPMAKAIEESNRSFGAGIFTCGLVKPALGSFFKYRVGGDPDRIEHFQGFQGPVDL